MMRISSAEDDGGCCCTLRGASRGGLDTATCRSGSTVRIRCAQGARGESFHQGKHALAFVWGCSCCDRPREVRQMLVEAGHGLRATLARQHESPQRRQPASVSCFAFTTNGSFELSSSFALDQTLVHDCSTIGPDVDSALHWPLLSLTICAISRESL